MSFRCRDKKNEKGFTLIEMTVSLAILVIVLVLSMTLLFSMKNFAQRQRQFAEPRQNARRAIDYVANYLRGAGEGNFRGNSPNAFVMHIKLGGVDTMTSFNNVTNGNFAEPGTDIISFAHARSGGAIRIARWSGGTGRFASASALWVNFRDGCPGGDTLNMEIFQEMTGCVGPGCNGTFHCQADCQSGVLTVMDSSGNWAYMQINGYMSSDCGSTDGDEISINANPGQTTGINQPGNRGVNCEPPQICAIGKGVDYICFRVKRTDAADEFSTQLQQRIGFFDSSNPDAGFFGLLDNIEDFQIAYIYNDGTIWNNGTNQLTTAGGIPTQGDDPPLLRDITNVVGIRLSVVARANTPVSFTERAKFFRQASEDRAEDPNMNRFFHYRLTSTVMIRNRNLGG